MKGVTITSASIPRPPVKLPVGLTRSGRNRAFARATPFTCTIEIIGARVVSQHLAACAWGMFSLSAQVVQLMGAYCADWAKMNLAVGENAKGEPHVRTGKLMEGIYTGTDGVPYRVGWNGMDMWIDVIAGENLTGHGEARARFLEWGFRHVGMKGKKFIRYPFMMPAADKVAPVFMRAMMQVAMLPNRFPAGLASLGGAPAGTLARLRPFLYTTSKALGDIQVFAGSPLVGRVRSLVLLSARRLGDLNAVMVGAVHNRIATRITGAYLGRIQGSIRMPTLTAPNSYSGMAGRVYNRYLGRGFGWGLRDLTTGI